MKGAFLALKARAFAQAIRLPGELQWLYTGSQHQPACGSAAQGTKIFRASRVNQNL